MNIALPPEYEALLQRLAKTETARSVWTYIIVRLMIDDQRARLQQTYEPGDNCTLVVQLSTGRSLRIKRPPITKEVEGYLLQLASAVRSYDLEVHA